MAQNKRGGPGSSVSESLKTFQIPDNLWSEINQAFGADAAKEIAERYQHWGAWIDLDEKRPTAAKIRNTLDEMKNTFENLLNNLENSDDYARDAVRDELAQRNSDGLNCPPNLTSLEEELGHVIKAVDKSKDKLKESQGRPKGRREMSQKIAFEFLDILYDKGVTMVNSRESRLAPILYEVLASLHDGLHGAEPDYAVTLIGEWRRSRG